MTDVEAKLAEFHRAFDYPPRETPGLPHPDTKELRIRLLREEFEETIAAIEADDLVEIADGLADLVYVAVGAALTYGIPFNRVFEEVHRTNMAKLSPCPTTGCRHPTDSDRRPGEQVSALSGCERCGHTGWVHLRDDGGKTQKPPGWQPPQIAKLLGLEE